MVAGDIGGSFGMKSAVYNEVGLVLLAAKVVGRPVMDQHPPEAFLGDAQARDMSPMPSWRSTGTAISPRCG